jgi:hypothetical protein
MYICEHSLEFKGSFRNVHNYLLHTKAAKMGQFSCLTNRSGLPDGLFSNQKSQFGYILEGLAMKNVGIFYDHLVYFTAIRNTLWPFGIVCGNLVYFPPLGILDREKSGNPAID